MPEVLHVAFKLFPVSREQYVVTFGDAHYVRDEQKKIRTLAVTKGSYIHAVCSLWR